MRCSGEYPESNTRQAALGSEEEHFVARLLFFFSIYKLHPFLFFFIRTDDTQRCLCLAAADKETRPPAIGFSFDYFQFTPQLN